jgi:hypothetical protein
MVSFGENEMADMAEQMRKEIGELTVLLLSIASAIIGDHVFAFESKFVCRAVYYLLRRVIFSIHRGYCGIYGRDRKYSLVFNHLPQGLSIPILSAENSCVK